MKIRGRLPPFSRHQKADPGNILKFVHISFMFLATALPHRGGKTRGSAGSFMHMPIVPVVGVGKDGRTVVGPWGYLNRKLPFIELPLRTAGPVPADSR